MKGNSTVMLGQASKNETWVINSYVCWTKFTIDDSRFFYFLHFCSAKNTKRWWCISSPRKEKKWSKKVDIRKWVDSFLGLIHMWSIFIYQDNRKRNVRQSMSQSPPLCILDQACWFPIKIIEYKIWKKCVSVS